MKYEIFDLTHFRDLAPADTPNADRHDGKCIGVYSSEARALEAMHRVADKPGFRDWPDGFRVFADTIGRVFWREGFIPGPAGADFAIAGDPSGRDGSDDGLAEWGQDESRDLAYWDAYLARCTDPDLLWQIYHCKISELNDQDYEDMGLKFLGTFASRAEAEAVRRTLADKPGFRDWPGGFRLYPIGLDHDQWLEGFAFADD